MKNFLLALAAAILMPALTLSGAGNENTLGDFIDASNVEAAAEAAADPVKDRYRLFIRKGDALFAQKNYKEASKYFYAAAKLMPKEKDGWKKAAFCMYQLKNHKFAYPFFKKVIELDPEDKDAVQFMEFYGNIKETKEKKKEKREMIDPLWRSALLPGWGQIHNNQMLKGIIASSAFSVSLGLTVYNIVDQRAKYDLYMKTNENHDIAYKKAQEASNTVLIFTLITTAIYGVQLYDAAVNYNSEEARMTVEIRPENTGASVFAAARW